MSRTKQLLAATTTSVLLAVAASTNPAQALEVAVQDGKCSFIYSVEEQIAMRSLSIEAYTIDHMQTRVPDFEIILEELEAELALMKKDSSFTTEEIKKQEALVKAFTKFLEGAKSCANGNNYNSEASTSDPDQSGKIALIVGAITIIIGVIAAAITFMPSLSVTSFPAFL